MPKRGLRALAAGLLAAVLLTGIEKDSVHAAPEYTVAEQKMIMYTADKAVVYAAPDMQSMIVTAIAPNLPIEVTGITSNGWYRIELKGTYYIPAAGLKEKPDEEKKSYTADEIKKLTSGTFSVFRNSELRRFTKKDIEEMDANTYIKYLDSYLLGNHTIENCILEDSGLTLKEAYEGESAADNSVASITKKDYLIAYRNEYLENSFWGPVRTQDELKVTINRAIRYDYKEFSTVYKSAVVGSESTKMEGVLKEIIADIKAEQGVSFSCEMEYGSFKNEQGKTTSGWILEFARK